MAVLTDARWRAALAGAFIAALAAHSVDAADPREFPARAVRLIVPFVGGTHDAGARAVSDKLAQRLGHPVVVENRGGAGGDLGASALAQAAPDGYTIGLLSSFHTINAGSSRSQGYRIDADFVPLALLGESPILFVASPGAPFATFPQLVAYARAHPGKLNFGSTNGFAAELLRAEGKVDFTVVLYKGISDAQVDLMMDRIDLSAATAAQVMPLVKQGRLRAMAVAGKSRLAELPEIPTVAETLPGFDLSIWFGLFAPAATPTPIVARLRRELRDLIATQEVQARLANTGIDARHGAVEPEQLMARIRSESQLWRRIAPGARPG